VEIRQNLKGLPRKGSVEIKGTLNAEKRNDKPNAKLCNGSGGGEGAEYRKENKGGACSRDKVERLKRRLRKGGDDNAYGITLYIAKTLSHNRGDENNRIALFRDEIGEGVKKGGLSQT